MCFWGVRSEWLPFITWPMGAERHALSSVTIPPNHSSLRCWFCHLSWHKHSLTAYAIMSASLLISLVCDRWRHAYWWAHRRCSRGLFDISRTKTEFPPVTTSTTTIIIIIIMILATTTTTTTTTIIIIIIIIITTISLSSPEAGTATSSPSDTYQTV